MRQFVLLMALLQMTCTPAPRLYCRDVRDCIGDGEAREAICAYDGSTGMYCAYSDKNCPSGFRYWEYVSGPVSNKCVDPKFLPTDGGTS